MAFKNALKLLINKFGTVWILLLYMLIFMSLLFCISLPFALPLLREIREAGIGGLIGSMFSSILNGNPLDVTFSHLYDILNAFKNLFLENMSAAFNAAMLLFLVFGFIFRFVLGLYEIPLCDIMDASMSSNARMGFMGAFVSRLGKSSKFVLVKMIYTLACDFIIFSIIYNMFAMFGVSVLRFFAPFIIMVAFLILMALRYTFIAMWAPSVVAGQKSIFKGLGFSFKRCFKHFGSVFSSYIIAWTLIIAFNLLVGIFTFGAGLLITVPISMLFVILLNMTIYYSKNNRRYYVDTAIVNPPQTL